MSEVTVKIAPNDVGVTIGSASMELCAESNVQIITEILDRDPYEGNYTITPTQHRIELPTKDKRMKENIVF